MIFLLGAFPSSKIKDKGFGHPKSEMGKTAPPKKPPTKEGSTSDDEGYKCPICDKGPYQHARSVHEHIRKKHPHYKQLVEMKEKIKAATNSPKKKCPYCKRLQSNLLRHRKRCKLRPAIPNSDIASASNDDFLTSFRARLAQPGSGLSSSTIANYMNYVRGFLRFELRLDPNFRAAQWFAPTGSENFRPFRSAAEFVPAHYRTSSTKNLLAVYKLLWGYVREEMTKNSSDPLTIHDNLLNSLKDVMKKVQKGRYHRGKRADLHRDADSDDSDEDVDQDRVDPARTEKILDDYLSSQSREDAFQACLEEAMEPGQEELFLALETFVRGSGIRLDVVRNVSVHDIRSARPVLDKCPFCSEMVIYRDHREYCKIRLRSLGLGGQDNFKEPQQWRVRIRDHKTGNISGIGKSYSECL